MMLLCRLQGFSISVSVYRDGETIVAVYRNPYGETVDRLFGATPEKITCHLEELDGVN